MFVQIYNFYHGFIYIQTDISHRNECSKANFPFRSIICKYNNTNAYVCTDIQVLPWIHIHTNRHKSP
jgi:hypothetical protein